MTADHLLPANATPLEQALSLATDALSRLAMPADAIRQFKTNPAEALLPWLVWEYGLEDFARAVPDLRALLSTGVQLQRLRGTPEGLRRALALLGLARITIVEGLPEAVHEARTRRDRSQRYGQTARWAQFQVHIDLGNDAGWAGVLPEQVRALVHAMRPARAHLAGIVVRARLRHRAGAPREAPPAWHIGCTLVSHRPGIRDGRILRERRQTVRRDGHTCYDARTLRTPPWTGRRFAAPAMWQAPPRRLYWQPGLTPPRVAVRHGRLRFDGTHRRNAFLAYDDGPTMTCEPLP